MQTILNIVVFVCVLGSIILIHEFGHFITAKYFNVYCSEFSMGMGPSIWHKQGKETVYHLRLLPVGGYVAMAGDANETQNEELQKIPLERSLLGIAWWKRIIVMSAGVFMNIVLAMVICVACYSTQGYVATDSNVVGTVQNNSAAYNAGIEAGDILKEINYEVDGKTVNYAISNWTDLGTALSIDSNHLSVDDNQAVIRVERNGNLLDLPITLGYNDVTNSFYLGITQEVRKMNFIEAVQTSVSSIAEMSVMIVKTLKNLVVHTSSTIGQLSGPAGVYNVTSEVTQEVAKSGQYADLFMLVAALSVNVGIFNLMPIPGLDGCQILFVLIEKIMGRPLSDNVKGGLTLIGLLLIIGLMIVVTIQDVSRMF